MSAGKVVGVLIDGEPTYHVQGVANDYDTLCGLDANDESIGHGGLIGVKRGQKIDCQQCRAVWSGVMAMHLRASNFEGEW